MRIVNWGKTMKTTPKFSRSFKDIAIALPICELLLLCALAMIKMSIVKNEFAYGHSLSQAYFLYMLIMSGIIMTTILPYLDYRNLIKKELTTPTIWKRNYILSLVILTLVVSLFITLYVQ
ncbi:MAG: hypothetical protein FD133_875 [Erysipelotrichaceae bacterium]|nr:MAG: hypothetical protein FD179_775 [Erysipelotrichaceae bacterium]TXT18379.1 MAG: hypothetical protein FD133_875 [Erysipelotrichaceae bacterium]